MERELNILPEDHQEDLDDLLLKENWYEGAVLWSTDWTAETIINQLKKGAINLTPRYQRRNAWDRKRKSRFIESLILGLPVPQIILAEDHTKRGSFIVIDGKQRLMALRQFAAEAGDEFEALKIEGLEDRHDLNGLNYTELRDDQKYADDARTFENQPIRTVVIRNWKDEQYLYSVFLRINTGSVQLSPQELRQALHPGPFTDYIDDLSTESVLLQNAMGISGPDFRMRDVELVLRFFAYRNFIAVYDGNLKRFLDSTVLKLNKKWSGGEPSIRDQGRALDYALGTTNEIFGDKQFKKWNGASFERVINRAVFDIMTFYFSDPDISAAAVLKKSDVVDAFKALCTSNRNFLSALETTTKSLEANRTRFNVWADTLSAVCGLTISHPIPDEAK